jgi:hypothetical protein
MASLKENGCNCTDEQHTNEDRQKHKHIEDECVHQDGTKHKIHKA